MADGGEVKPKKLQDILERFRAETKKNREMMQRFKNPSGKWTLEEAKKQNSAIDCRPAVGENSKFEIVWAGDLKGQFRAPLESTKAKLPDKPHLSDIDVCKDMKQDLPKEVIVQDATSATYNSSADDEISSIGHQPNEKEMLQRELTEVRFEYEAMKKEKHTMKKQLIGIAKKNQQLSTRYENNIRDMKKEMDELRAKDTKLLKELDALQKLNKVGSYRDVFSKDEKQSRKDSTSAKGLAMRNEMELLRHKSERLLKQNDELLKERDALKKKLSRARQWRSSADLWKQQSERLLQEKEQLQDERDALKHKLKVHQEKPWARSTSPLTLADFEEEDDYFERVEI